MISPIEDSDIPAQAVADSSDELWRQLVFPTGYQNPTPAGRYGLLVVGAGPAGLTAAMGAALLGAKVALIEHQAMGGDCLNVGCVPSKTLLASAAQGLAFQEAMGRVRRVRAQIAHHDSVERYTNAGVDVFLGSARFVNAREVRVGDQVLCARKIMIATGARALIPPVPGLKELRPLTNETVFDLTEQPRRMAILGAGPIGCELAQAFARLGTRVELVELQARVLPKEEPEAADLVARALMRDGILLHLGTRVVSAHRDDDVRVLELENGERIKCDAVLAALGRLRNVENLNLEATGIRFEPGSGIEVNSRLETTQGGVYAAGDVCSQYQFTHNSDAQARIVIRNALFLGRARADRLVIPWCTYTKPEVAHAGATRAQLEGAGQVFDRYHVDFGDLDRSGTDDGADGYVEVLTEKGADRIIGATIVGRDAGEQLAPLLLMMARNIGLSMLGNLVLPYPTRSEYLRRLGDAYQRTRLTPLATRVLRWWLNRGR